MGSLSPLAPDSFPDLAPLDHVRFFTAETGLRYRDRDDLLLVELPEGTVIAGVLTKSLTRSAPIDWCRDGLKQGKARAIVVNAGNANAFTGRAGEALVRETARVVASRLGVAEREVFIASTGVIGQPLPARAIADALPKLRPADWEAAAKAILTTDTFAKGATGTVIIGGRTITVSGFAKGSGMIAPDMATMLAFVFTDAAIAVPVLQGMVTRATATSFNAITVDGDTSTSDTLLVAATGTAGNAPFDEASAEGVAFYKTLESVLIDLAQQIVRDGEGASKFVTIAVSGARSDEAARRVAFSIANSPLVKTAIAGEDANWGRIVMAVGKSGEEADRDRLDIRIGGVLIAAEGMEVPGYDEAPVAMHMKGQTVEIAVNLNLGDGAATVWTCDLTHGYIDINGSYRS
jgi:glutamate N-acetyltransferase/amino-acid N-acetyltransferase